MLVSSKQTHSGGDSVALGTVCLSLFPHLQGTAIAQWLERRTRAERSRVQIPVEAAGEFSSPDSTFCADSIFGIRSTPVLPQ